MTSPDPGKAPATGGLPRTRREHRRIRSEAERRRSGAQRSFNRLQRESRHELRGLRRLGGTIAVVGRSRLAEMGVRGITGLTSRLRSPRAKP